MAQNHPTVQEDTLMDHIDGRTQEILLGTPEWSGSQGSLQVFADQTIASIKC